MSDLFPELEEPKAERPPVIIPLSKNPDGKRLVAGPRAAARLATLAGLPGRWTADGGLRIARVTATMATGRIELGLLGGGLPPLEVHLVPMWPTIKGGMDFMVGLSGAVPSVEVQEILSAMGDALGRHRYPLLVKILLVDPDRRIEALPQQGTDIPYVPGDEYGPDSPQGFAASLVATYAGELAWREFFADREQVRNFQHALRGRIVTVEHGDLECHYATPTVGDGTVSFFNYSNAHDRYIKDLMDGVDPGSSTLLEPAGLITDMDERDVIMGGASKLYAALKSIEARSERPELVLARGTCVPIVIGDDLRGAIDRFQSETGIETIFLDDLADGHTDPFQVVYKRLQAGWGDVPPAEQVGRLNLIGYPSHASTGELVRGLESMGITINAMLVPDVDMAAMRRFAHAELSVFFDSVLFDTSYNRLFAASSLPKLRPVPPFGPTRCRAWLKAVAEAMGRGGAADAAWEAIWAPHAADWATLQEEARGYRLGFVIDERRLRTLLNPRDLTGVPVLELLLEQGFVLDFLYYGDDPAPLLEALPALDAQALEPATWSTFTTPAELGVRLQESEAVAFYSELYFDRRLTRCGKAQFSVRDFKLGPAGAIESARQLIRTCRLPFYRVYADYLGEPFAGEAT